MRSELPEGWVWRPLGELCRVVGGSTPSRRRPEYFKGGIVWVTPSELKGDGSVEVITDSNDRISEEGLASCAAQLVPPGTVLFSSRASIGKVGIAGVSLATNQGFANFICGSELDNWFLAYWLRFKTPGIQELAGRTTYREVSKSTLKGVEIPLPPLEEQRRIMARIEELTRPIEEARRLRQAAREQTEKIMPAALAEVFGRAEKEGWERKQLGEVCKVVGGNTPSRKRPEYFQGDIVWITPSNLSADGPIQEIASSREKITEEGLASCSAQLLPPGAVLYSSRATIGKIAIAEVPLATNQGFANFICTEHLDNRFLAYWLRYKTPSIEEMANRTTYREISKSKLRGVEIWLPPLADQRHIAAYFDGLQDTVEHLRRLQEETQAQLDALIPAILGKAFRGEL